MTLSPKAIITHICVIALFILASLVYFYPVLQGKAIFQSDIAQYKGMAQERDAYKDLTGEESYWTNSAFGGMPTYQLGANYPHNYIKELDRLIRFLPRPADYLFLYLIGFYILLLCLKVDFRLAALGAVAFGFSTYLIIILGVGHNAKAHALGYIPMVLGGIVLVFRKKYILGFILTALAMALEISANHYQMTYYFMLLVLVMGLVYLIYAIKEKELKHFFASVGILILAVTLSIFTNATSLLATKEYADWSTRGTSELTINPDGSEKAVSTGLDYEYITQYSYGIAESLNLFAPRLFGGSGNEDLGRDSKAYEYLTDQGLSPSKALEFSSGLPLYWGDQPIVAAPAYVGAIVFFLFVLGAFLVDGKKKWWLLTGAILSLLLSWGKNFPLLTNFMIDYFPLYNKFRAVSSIQVVLELCLPVLGILGIRELFKSSVDQKEKLKALKLSFFISLGLGILIFLLKGFFDFEGLRDETYRGYFGDELMTMIQRDREAVYINDTIRSIIYVVLAAAVLWFFIKDKINKNILVFALGALILFDLVGVDLRYVNEGDFVRQRQVNQPFQANQIDQMIQQDDSIYRVFDPQEGINGARTSYFHKSIGGYHAAKPRALQNLFEYHLYQNNLQVLNMLNVKYIIQQDEEGNSYPAVNPDANGNAWFVDQLLPVSSANEEILKLKDFNSKTQAVVNTSEYPELTKLRYSVDSLARIDLVDYRPNNITYTTNNPNDGFAVFSEMHYPSGWHAFIDGTPQEHYRVDYALRGMKVPAGQHNIEFRFEPEVVETGSQITLAANALLGLIIVGGLGFTLFRRKKKKRDA
ncbi:MAG: YfhO family protein [Muricauda sp.]|nr:YfhO family protein [Allomuricauda sp.]MBO6532203.1 YfhO family protein [Allomuricauda sp.]MBO6590099.1 YfhO family protein [Allomuricauda sp.]MBO6619753.1 YfhO family protein [Allomuricauda sp.]MBO6645620.1 YfhO family protein [Allomuricauda sp.]MBO6748091.1 YfhO family protein [Allomuricauda sp.]